MNNYESSMNLFKEAKRYFKEMNEVFEEKMFNTTIRKAQEVVELCLKSFCKALGIEYPKSHEVGDIFIKEAKDYYKEADFKDLEKINKISKELVKKREPAFYFDKIYNYDEAFKAKNDAEFVFEFIKKYLEEKIYKKEI